MFAISVPEFVRSLLALMSSMLLAATVPVLVMSDAPPRIESPPGSRY